MKKQTTLFVIILCFILSFLFSSCTKNEDETPSIQKEWPPGCESDNEYTRWNALSAKSGNVLYYLDHAFGNAEYLLFTDLDANVSGLLCGKPECSHSDVNCNAWLGKGAACLFLYDSRIYWVSFDREKAARFLFRMDKNGENHEQVFSLTDSPDDADDIYPSVNTTLKAHHGILYASGQNSRIEKGVQRAHHQITGYNLDSGDFYTVYQSKDYIDSGGRGIYIQPRKDELLFLEYYNGAEADHTKEKSYLRVSRYDISRKQTEILYESSYPDDSTVTDAFLTGDSFYIASQGQDGFSSLRAVDLTKKELILRYTIEELSMSWLSEGIMATYFMPEEDRIRLTFTDFDGNVLSDQWYPLRDIKARTFMMAGLDRDRLCLLYDDAQTEAAFIEIPTDGGNLKVLRHELIK